MLKNIIQSVANKIGLSRVLNNFRKKACFVKNITVKNTLVRIPVIQGASCSVSEPWMLELLSTIMAARDGVFIDVGVNLGQTLVKVKAIEANREYIGFEPNPFCVWYASYLVKQNSYERCTLFPVGLFTENSVLALDFYSSDEGDSSASLISHFRSSAKVHSQIFVPVFNYRSLQPFFDNKSVGIIKIDVEGAELEVLQSIRELIVTQKPIIIIEILPVYSLENVDRKNRQDEIEKLFLDEDYVLHRVEKSASNSYTGLSQIDRIGIHSDINRCDYVMVPNDQLNVFATRV